MGQMNRPPPLFSLDRRVQAKKAKNILDDAMAVDPDGDRETFGNDSPLHSARSYASSRATTADTVIFEHGRSSPGSRSSPGPLMGASSSSAVSLSPGAAKELRPATRGASPSAAARAHGGSRPSTSMFEQS